MDEWSGVRLERGGWAPLGERLSRCEAEAPGVLYPRILASSRSRALAPHALQARQGRETMGIASAERCRGTEG